MLGDIVGLIPDYRSWTREDYLFHILWGLVGAFLRLTYSNAPLKKWEMTKDGLKLNAAGEWFTSFVIGTLANTNPAVSVVAAWVAPSFMEEAERIMTEGLRLRLRRLVLGDISVVEAEDDRKGGGQDGRTSARRNE